MKYSLICVFLFTYSSLQDISVKLINDASGVLRSYQSIKISVQSITFKNELLLEKICYIKEMTFLHPRIKNLASFFPSAPHKIFDHRKF